MNRNHEYRPNYAVFDLPTFFTTTPFLGICCPKEENNSNRTQLCATI